MPRGYQVVPHGRPQYAQTAAGPAPPTPEREPAALDRGGARARGGGAHGEWRKQLSCERGAERDRAPGPTGRQVKAKTEKVEQRNGLHLLLSCFF